MPRRPRIALVNAWHDDNRGDSAIAQATINLLRTRWPESEITVVSLLDAAHPEFSDAYRHLGARFADIDVVGNAMPHLDRSGGLVPMASRSIRFASRVPGALAAVIAPRLARRDAFTTIRTADLVVVNGGQSIYSHRRSALAWINLLRVLLPVYYAHRAARPTILLGHSLGPFPDRPSRWIASSVLREVDTVIVREALSEKLAESLGIAVERLGVAPDVAFAIRPRETDRVREILRSCGLVDHGFWVITVRQVYESADRLARTERFLDEMADFATAALDGGHTERIVLFAHTIGPVDNEDDRPATNRLKDKLDDERVIVVDEDLDPEEIAAFYGHARLLIGTRLHSVILALAARTPAVAISYFGPKAYGTMTLIGEPSLCVGIDEVEGRDLLALIERSDPVGRTDQISARAEALAADVTRTLDRLELRTDAPSSAR